MDEYAHAARMDYSDLSEEVADHTEVFSALVRRHADYPIPGEEITRARAALWICPAGSGHWLRWCGEGCS